MSAANQEQQCAVNAGPSIEGFNIRKIKLSEIEFGNQLDGLTDAIILVSMEVLQAIPDYIVYELEKDNIFFMSPDTGPSAIRSSDGQIDYVINLILHYCSNKRI